MRIFNRLIFILLLFSPVHTVTVFSEIYEAESVPRTSQAEIVTCEECSGGEAVNMKDGDLTFTIDIPEDGYYAVDLFCSSPYGDNKQQKVRLDNSVTGVVDFGPAFDEFRILNAISRYNFTSGTHTVAIVNSWGWVVIDYIEITPVDASEIVHFSIGGLTNPQASLEARKLYDYLRVNFGSSVVSGMMIASPRGALQEVEALESKVGHKPALIGLDFLHDVGYGTEWHAHGADSLQVYTDAKRWYEEYNGISAICWHWRDPAKENEGFYSPSADNDQAKTSFDIRGILDESSPEYRMMIDDMDVIAKHLKRLRDDHIPVLWRPLHEASGGWFWWGLGGPDACKALWRTMYDRFTNHHGLDNLIWVWTTDTRGSAPEWYPGEQYVDIVGIDIYTTPPEHSSQFFEFEKVKDITGAKKIIALSECGAIPSAANMKRDGAWWSWFMPWYHDYTLGYHNQEETWRELFAADHVVRVTDLPDWNGYEIRVSVRPGRPLSPTPSGAIAVVPRGNGLLVRFPRNATPGEYKICLHSIDGRLLYRSGTVAARDDSGTMLLSSIFCHPGTYVLVVHGRNSRYVRRFIAEKR